MPWSGWKAGHSLLPLMADAERQNDLRETPEQREEADPEQDQIGSLGQCVGAVGAGYPERQQEQQDPCDQAEPPIRVHGARGDRSYDLKRAVENQDEPEDRDQCEESVDRLDEPPQRAEEEDDGHDDVPDLPTTRHHGGQGDLVDPRAEEYHSQQHATGREGRTVKPPHTHRDY